MSSGWKNPFMKETQTYENDMNKNMEENSKHLDSFNIDVKKMKTSYTKDRYGSK